MSNSADQKRWLEALESEGDVSGAWRKTGIPRNTAYSWKHRYPTFAGQWDIALGRYGRPPIEPGEVPDFLTWRENHCAYLDPQKKVRAAQNFWYQQDWIRQMESSNRLILVLHPGAGKTTSVSEFVTWNIMRDRNFRATIIRANEDEAKKNVGSIGRKLLCDDYHWLIEQMQLQGDEPIRCPVCTYGGSEGFAPNPSGRGRAIDDQWARGALSVVGRTSGDKEPTVQAYGANSPIAGVRSDLIVLDDAQDPGKFRSQGFPHSEKMFDWFREDVLGRLYDHQKLVVIGNRLGAFDFVGKLIAEYGEDWTVVYYPAVINDHLDPKRGTPQVLVPELWTYEGLQRKRKEVGEEVWAFQWQQQEVDDSTATFPAELMDSCKNYDRSIGERSRSTDVVLGIDPALKQFCAMVALGLDRYTGKRYLIDYVNERGMGRIENLVARAVTLVQSYEIRTAVVETNNTQQTFYQAVKEALAPLGCRTIPYNTVTSMGAQAEQTDFDISSIADLMANKLVDIPYQLGDRDTRARIDLLVEQFRLWFPRPKGKSSHHLVRDLVMAWLFAESEVRHLVRLARRDTDEPYVSDAPSWTMNADGRWANMPPLGDKAPLDSAGSR